MPVAALLPGRYRRGGGCAPHRTYEFKEAVMGQPIPQQHPAVVLRSHYRHVKALLAVAMLAVAALAVTVVLLATDPDDPARGASQGVGATPVQVESISAQTEQRRAAIHGKASPPRYDGGPSEGTVGLGH
jgi:hypothetical protein